MEAKTNQFIKIMSKIKYLSAFLLLFTAFNFTSCEGDIEPIDGTVVLNPGGENPDGGTTEPGLFKVDFDSQNFSTSSTQVYLSGGSIIINAFRSNGENFGFILDGTAVGTYAANKNFVTYTPAGSEYGFSADHPTDENFDTGSVVITSINTTNKTISGTFHFKGYWSDFDDNSVAPKDFTNGTFTNLPYITTNPTGDSFFAKVNGVEFVDNDIFTVESGSGTQNFISIAALNAADEEITVSVNSSLAVGTYPITGATNSNVNVIYALPTSDFGTRAATGNVTISEKTSTRIKGTFTATVTIDAVNYQITEGAFDVEY